MKVKIGILLAALLLLVAGFYGRSLSKSNKGITTTAAGQKLSAYYNAHSQSAQIAKTLRCLKGKNNVYLCAALAADASGNTACVLVLGEVTNTTTKIDTVTVDQGACYFA